MLTYLLYSCRDGTERRIDWVAAIVIDCITTAWVVFVTAAAVRVFYG